MKGSRYFRLAVLVVVLLVATSAITWRSLAAPPGDSPTGGPAPPGSLPGVSEPVPGGPGFYTQSAWLFTPYTPTTEWGYHYDGVLYNPGSQNAYYIAPVSLPNGVTVTKLVAYYKDSSADHLTLKLYGWDGLGTWKRMGTVASLDTIGYGSAETESIGHAVIDLQTYSYTLWLYIPGGSGIDLGLANVRIDYAYPTTLPLVTSNAAP
jgi:hypothetical protein